MEKLKIGIAGSVGHAEKFVNLINSYEESEVIVYCAKDDDSIAIANRLGLAHEGDFYLMLEKYPLDGVIITVPNAEKRELVIAAAKAGVSIFLEKPLATKSEDALAMQAAIHQSGVHFYMSDPFIRPGILMLKRLINTGALGEIVGADVRHAGSQALTDHHLPHIYTKALSGGGIMADVGGHPLHIIHYLFGMPSSLCSSLRSFTDDAKVAQIEESATALLHYATGMNVCLEASWISGGGNSSRTAVYGTAAWAEVTDLPGKEGSQQLTLHSANNTVSVYSEEQLPPMPIRHVRYFVEMLLHQLPNDIIGTVEESNCGVSIDHAVELAQIIEAFYAAPNKQFVSL